MQQKSLVLALGPTSSNYACSFEQSEVLARLDCLRPLDDISVEIPSKWTVRRFGPVSIRYVYLQPGLNGVPLIDAGDHFG